MYLFSRRAFPFLLFFVVLSLAAFSVLASGQPDGPPAPAAAGRFTPPADAAPLAAPGAAAPLAAGQCRQLLENPALTVSEGRITGWGVLQQKVYSITDSFVSAPNALGIVDADSGDESPTQDAFAQGFAMPADAAAVSIVFQTQTVGANAKDRALGNLWTLDAEGALDTFIFGWDIDENEGGWQRQEAAVPADALRKLAGRPAAIILFNKTDGAAPGEASLFDDVTLTACAAEEPPPTATATSSPSPAATTRPATATPTATPSPRPPRSNRSLVPVVMAGSGGNRTEPPATATPPTGGAAITFRGTTDQGLPVEIEVDEAFANVTRVEITWRARCPGFSATGTRTYSGRWAITGGAFAIVSPVAPPGDEEDRITGTFDGASASGTWELWVTDFDRGPVCSGGGSWTASRMP